jgi:hypothetical protein
MAWRIGHAVVRGEIDNTVPGRTVGRVWLLGREEPVSLELQGDCWRDLAGSRMEFRNPAPELDPGVLAALADPQRGVVGDITASRRVRAVVRNRDFTQPEEFPEDGPYEWRNCLYIEWFSQGNGRVVIESDAFNVRPGEVKWRMDAESDHAQKMMNMQAMRDYLDVIIQRREESDGDGGRKREASEFEWEKRLQESDRMSQAYQEVVEKYKDDPDSEKKGAFAMGWDSLLSALDNRGGASDAEADEAWDDDDWEEMDWDDEDFEDDGEFEEQPVLEDLPTHPLQTLAEEVAMRTYEFSVGEDGPADSSANRLAAGMIKVCAKLGSLDLAGEGFRPEIGYILAVLKRCLHVLNEALAACQELIPEEKDPNRKRMLESIREGIFEIRNGAVELRREMRRKGGNQG